MNKKNLLSIQTLDVSAQNLPILNDLNFQINESEIHVIMGPNGCGKSTLSKVLTGHPLYQINNGKIFFKGNDITSLSPEERANSGIFLAFQYPLEISGLTTFDFLLFSYNQKQKYLEKPLLEPLSFLTYVQIFCKKLNIQEDFLYRNLNEGFSGGEKKKMEILQMFILNPDLVILDELDSGLDIDALRIIYKNIQEYALANKEKSFIIISHNFKIFDYIKPNYIHLMLKGKIIKSGDIKLLKELEQNGYSFLTEENSVKNLLILR